MPSGSSNASLASRGVTPATRGTSTPYLTTGSVTAQEGSSSASHSSRGVDALDRGGRLVHVEGPPRWAVAQPAHARGVAALHRVDTQGVGENRGVLHEGPGGLRDGRPLVGAHAGVLEGLGQQRERRVVVEDGKAPAGCEVELRCGLGVLAQQLLQAARPARTARRAPGRAPGARPSRTRRASRPRPGRGPGGPPLASASRRELPSSLMSPPGGSPPDAAPGRRYAARPPG